MLFLFFNSYLSSWLFKSTSKWTITSIMIDATHVFDIFTDGSIYSTDNNTYKPFDVYPCAYLSSSIKITGGDGSQNNPYKIS